MISTEETKCGPGCRHEDKSDFPDGAWRDEPDRVEFEHQGFSCLLHRAPLGNWCGYVALPPGHPAHGVDYESIYGIDGLDDLSVHGGLTYAKGCVAAICHVPKPGEPDDIWWLGFDCGHAGDLTPGLLRFRAALSDWEHYRDLAYVKRETESLAEQLAAVASVALKAAA